MSTMAALDRRSCRRSDNLTPTELIRSHVDSAQRQLAAAREGLIAARRRVVALETAVQNWGEMAHEAAGNRRAMTR